MFSRKGGNIMSKKKREIERLKKEKVRQKKRREKEKRQFNDPYKWDQKKRKRQSKQLEIWETQYPDSNKDCSLLLSKFPSPENCSGCKLVCRYNHN